MSRVGVVGDRCMQGQAACQRRCRQPMLPAGTGAKPGGKHGTGWGTRASVQLLSKTLVQATSISTSISTGSARQLGGMTLAS